jgi:hypothetical protein
MTFVGSADGTAIAPKADIASAWSSVLKRWTPTVTEAAATQDTEEAPERTRPRLNVITGTPNPVGTVLENGCTQVSSAVTNAQSQLETAVGSAQSQITGAVTNVVKSVTGAVGGLGTPAASASTDSTGGATP